MVLIRKKTFTGQSFLHSAADNGLAAIIRGLAQDNARAKIEVAGVGDFTDNTTGTATGVAVTALVVPSALFDATSVDGAPATAFNTAIGVFENNGAVFADHLNNARVRIGLPLMTWASGTIATAATLPVMTKSLSGTTGATAIDFVEGLARMNSARDNLATMARGLNEILEALGDTNITDNSGGTPDFADVALDTIADAAANADGSSSISDTVMDAFLLQLANGVATLADRFNDAMEQAGPSDLTNNAGGTTSDILAAMTAPPAFQSSGADSLTKTLWEVELAKYRNNFADITARANLLLGKYSLTQLTDSSAGSANTTVEAVLATIADADPSTGPQGVERATHASTFALIMNNFASVTAKINLLVPFFGAVGMTDSSGGTAGAIIVAMPDSGDAVDGTDETTNATVASTPSDVQLAIIRNAFTSLAAKLNEMTGEGITKALKVTAAL